ncbi:MAG: phosphatidylinositol mannoside acyltransferase [Actinobacteria bacterium 13_2_20CM_2_72_6]|nr:MAG: phosphatidylinositol mannoside acyltransferase [Actinobacteria bacterium 13_2_20CM_2_72_6]
MNSVETAYAVGWRVVRALPAPVARAAFTAAADLTVRRNPKGVARLRENLRRVAGPDNLDALVRAGMRSYLRYYLEAFRLPGYSRKDILRMFRLDGEALLRADVESGRGAIVALPHAANWDLAGAWAAAKGWPLVAIAERLKPEGLYRRFVEFRERLGMEIIPLTGAEKPPFDLLVERLAKGYIVALLADRDLPGRGVEVDFFGAPTTMPPGPAMLALRSGAPLYAVDMWYERDAVCARLDGPLPVPAPDSGSLTERIRVLTQDLADRFAAGIARHPEDWHMLQRMWREPARTGDRSR